MNTIEMLGRALRHETLTIEAGKSVDKSRMPLLEEKLERCLRYFGTETEGMTLGERLVLMAGMYHAVAQTVEEETETSRA